MDINQICKLLIQNEVESKYTINMVPSENFASVFSRIPLLLDIYNRYFFNSSVEPSEWNFRGGQGVYELETDVAIPILKELSKARYVNIRPISGLNGMALVLKALGKTGNSDILTVSPDQGGHYATKDLAQSFGLNVGFLPGIDEHTFDFKALENIMSKKKIGLIYIDQSHCLFPIDVKRLANIVKSISPETIIHLDISHWLGLVLGQAMPNPLECGADSFGGSTHKTFPGPQRAVFCTNREDLAVRVQQAQYYMISSHHFGSVASLAISLLEFKDKGGFNYANQVIKNSKLLAKSLHSCGFDVKGEKYGFTAGHQIWMSTSNCGVDSYEASERLYKCGIKVNALPDIPGTNEITLRIGVNEITRLGAKEEDIEQLSNIIDIAILNKETKEETKKLVKGLREKISDTYGYNLNDSQFSCVALQLLNSALNYNNLKK
jgi:Glycine/serine hydroxymethyltransferase